MAIKMTIPLYKSSPVYSDKYQYYTVWSCASYFTLKKKKLLNKRMDLVNRNAGVLLFLKRQQKVLQQFIFVT